jgi:hypothetical protein
VLLQVADLLPHPPWQLACRAHRPHTICRPVYHQTDYESFKAQATFFLFLRRNQLTEHWLIRSFQVQQHFVRHIVPIVIKVVGRPSIGNIQHVHGIDCVLHKCADKDPRVIYQ